MQKNCLISNYSFYFHNYQNIHSAGPKVYFYNPCIGYVKKGYAKFLYKGQTLYAYEGDLIYIAYKHNIMIQHALDLLSHTNLSIEEINTRVGFSSSNYFRKIFIRLTGKTPKELR